MVGCFLGTFFIYSQIVLYTRVCNDNLCLFMPIRCLENVELIGLSKRNVIMTGQ
jgi:hypothetical protein